MENMIEHWVDLFASGQLTRRELVVQLGAALSLLAAAPSVSAGGKGETAYIIENDFKATGINHIAIRVTDIERSKRFYMKHLGMEVAMERPGFQCFLKYRDTDGFLALFRGDKPQMDHFCFAVADYDVQEAVTKLRAAGLNPRNPSNTRRVYFEDPDGHTIQLASHDHNP